MTEATDEIKRLIILHCDNDVHKSIMDGIICTLFLPSPCAEMKPWSSVLYTVPHCAVSLVENKVKLAI